MGIFSLRKTSKYQKEETKQKSIIDVHTKKKKESKQNTKVSNQMTREENKRSEKRPTKTNPK